MMIIFAPSTKSELLFIPNRSLLGAWLLITRGDGASSNSLHVTDLNSSPDFSSCQRYD